MNLKRGSTLLIVLLVLSLISTSAAGYLYWKFKRIQSVEKVVTQEKIITKIPEETARSLFIRCGDYPLKVASLPSNRFIRVILSWSPDCRHIAWSLNRSSPGGFWEGPEKTIPKDFIPWDQRSTEADEGIFLYEDKTGKITTIYHNKTKGEAESFEKWQDSEIFLVKYPDGKLYRYDISASQFID